jgi:hypothetical protein
MNNISGYVSVQLLIRASTLPEAAFPQVPFLTIIGDNDKVPLPCPCSRGRGCFATHDTSAALSGHKIDTPTTIPTSSPSTRRTLPPDAVNDGMLATPNPSNKRTYAPSKLSVPCRTPPPTYTPNFAVYGNVVRQRSTKKRVIVDEVMVLLTIMRPRRMRRRVKRNVHRLTLAASFIN